MAADRLALDADITRRIRQIRDGDDTGYTALYELLGGRVAGYLRSRGVADVDDVVNEVFLAAFRGFGSFEGGGARFRSWLFAIAWNKSVDWHRTAGRHVPTRPLTDDHAAVAGGDVENDALRHLGDDRVEALLATLTDDQRDVLLLRIVADLSLQQVAEILGKPVGAVKSLQHRALASLGRHLRPANESDENDSGEAVSPEATRTTTEST